MMSDRATPRIRTATNQILNFTVESEVNFAEQNAVNTVLLLQKSGSGAMRQNVELRTDVCIVCVQQ
jgi:hypothetical protein